MNLKTISILLVEDNLADFVRIAKLLENSRLLKIELDRVSSVKQASQMIDCDRFDLILLSIPLSLNRNLSEIESLKQKAPELPIIIVSEIDDLDLATQAICLGAQDYLIKEELETKILIRSMQSAIERQRHAFKANLQALMKKMLDRIRQSIVPKAILQTTSEVVREFLQCDRLLIYGAESGHSAKVIAVSDAVKLEFGSQDCSLEKFTHAINFFPRHSILSELTSIQTVRDTHDCRPQELIVEPNIVRSYLLLPIWLEASAISIDEDPTLCLTKHISHQKEEGRWGMLVAYNIHHTRCWQEWEIDFLQSLIGQVSKEIQQSQLCCRLQRANKKLQQLAILDGLTEIANRRYFNLVLDNEWQRLAREQQPLSLILCDVDYFKAYNDTYGHQQGDRCLQTIARILQQSTRRPADLVARYGGEEFAIVLPNTNAPGALFLAHRIVRLLAKQRLPHHQSQVSESVTLSLGITTKIPDRKQLSSTIIEAADSMMYRAKKAGRNQLAVDNWLVSSHRA